jgi:hypothetical protein
MNSQAFERRLHANLAHFFDAYEFELLASKKQFRRPLPNGFQNVILSHQVLGNECWVEVNIGTRLHAIEHFAQQFLDNLPGYRADANTVVVSIGKLSDNKYFRYQVRSDSDLSDLCEAVADFMAERGFAFLEGMSTVPDLDRAFNARPREAFKYVYNQTHRCFKGLVAAKLHHNPQFEQLAEIYAGYLARTGAKPDLAASFHRMADFLRHYSPN